MDMEQHTPHLAEVARPWTRPVVLVPVFVLISLVGGALPSFSLGADLLVLGTGGALFWLGLSQRVPRPPAPRRLPAGAVWWLLPLLCFALVELVNFALGSSPAHPTFSKLTDPYLTRYSVRAAAYFGWLSAFWGMVKR
jgi:hypothetical protein